jgi:uncharacterized protein Yka (UPF0111/DUF47 family)
MKSKIIERLGETDILLPSLIEEGFLANNRVKARLSVLQAAGRHARDPRMQSFDLSRECRAAGLDPMAMEGLVNHASLISGDGVTAPGLGRLGVAIFDDVEAMAHSVAAGDATAGEKGLERLSALRGGAASDASDTLELSRIAKLTRLGQHEGDSLHRLVMDLHRDLNRLSAAHAHEVLAGAHVSGLLPQDRTAVEAFMRGMESTKRLKFEHPGLGTNASRSAGRLVIQNDIGETDAHVVIIAVEEDAVTVTYTDVHVARAKFFTRLLRDFPFSWSGLDRKSSGDLDSAFYLVTGTCPTPDAAKRELLLSALGAALVFLIDWNKARKTLRALVSKKGAVAILEWAARNKVGHRGFLELGGQELVAAAVHSGAASRIGFGERLEGALGREQALDFLKTVLRISTEALLEGSSVRMARDRIAADLARRLQRVDAALLAVVLRQAGLAHDIASNLARFIANLNGRSASDGPALAAGARRIEEKADRIAMEARVEIARFDADRAIERLVNGIEDVIDELEQAAFMAALVPNTLPPELLAPLGELCAAALSGVQAASTGLAAAAEVPEGHRVDSEKALSAVGKLIEAEHAADAAERAVTATILRGEFDLKTALSVIDLARSVERATDRLAGFGHQLREHVLADLSR